MDQTGEFPMRRETPPIEVPEALLAAMSLDDPDAAAAAPVIPPAGEMVLLVDPTTRRLIVPAVPVGMAEQLRQVFDRLVARGHADTAEARRDCERVSSIARELRGEIGAAAMIAHELRALMYLFDKAVTEDGEDTLLTASARLVVDCAGTMARRLEALDERAEIAAAPLWERRPG